RGPAREGAARRRRRARADRESARGGVRADHRVAPRPRPRAGCDDARPPWHAQGRRRRRRRRRARQGARPLQLPRREDQRGAAGINENDVNLASASNAMVVGFNVRPSAEARALAEREGVEIRTYRVIYQLTDDIEQALVGMLRPVTTEETIGEVEVRQLFRVSRLGTIAGSYVTEGNVRRGGRAR